jgi:hypothetical protein
MELTDLPSGSRSKGRDVVHPSRLSSSPWVLGISAYYHDSAACLTKAGKIVAAAQEERFNRQKHYPGFPAQAISYCLREGGVTLGDLRCIAFYDKPLLKFERLLHTYLSFAPRGLRSFWAAMPVWLKEKLFLKRLLERELGALEPGLRRSELAPLLFGEHHESHAASAFYPSPFDRAAILSGWRWRVGHDVGVDRSAERYRPPVGHRVPQLARPALFGIHVLYGLQG